MFYALLFTGLIFMEKDKSSLKGPLSFIAILVVIELGLALLAVNDIQWAGIALFVILTSIQACTLLLVWYLLRLLVVLNNRVKNIEFRKR